MVMLAVLLMLLVAVIMVMQLSAASVDANALYRHVEARERYYVASRSVVEMAMELLRSDSNDYDGAGDFWAIGRQELPFEGRTFTLEIQDEDRRLPVNLIGGEAEEADAWGKALKRFVQRAGLPPDEAVDCLADWIDQDSLRRSSGAEQGDYGADFMVKNAPLDSIGELESIRGWSPPRLAAPPNPTRDPLEGLMGERPEFQKIKELRELEKRGLQKPPTTGTGGSEFGSEWPDWVTVWSGGTVNVNTAPLEVLLALDEGLSETTVQEILRKREQEPLRSAADLQKLPGVDSDLAYRLGKLLGYKSKFFRIRVSIEEQPGRMTLDAVVRREGGSLKVVEWTAH